MKNDKTGFTPLEHYGKNGRLDKSRLSLTGFIQLEHYGKNRRLDKSRLSLTGFTLVELMVSILVSTVVVGGVFAVFFMSQKMWIEGTSAARVQMEAGLVLEKIVRGVDGQHGLREAQQSTITFTDQNNDGNDDRIDYTDIDGSNRFFRYRAEQEDILTDVSNSPIAERVTDLVFLQPNPATKPGWLRISVTVQRTVQGKPIQTNIKTDVLVRN